MEEGEEKVGEAAEETTAETLTDVVVEATIDETTEDISIEDAVVADEEKIAEISSAVEDVGSTEERLGTLDLLRADATQEIEGLLIRRLTPTYLVDGQDEEDHRLDIRHRLHAPIPVPLHVVVGDHPRALAHVDVYPGLQIDGAQIEGEVEEEEMLAQGVGRVADHQASQTATPLAHHHQDDGLL